MRKNHCTAIVVAAGQGKRMGTDVPKQYLELQGKPVICHTLQVFQDSELIDDIVIVADRKEISRIQDEIVETYGFRKVIAIAAGGAERYESVMEGLNILKDEPAEGKHYVFIHDGVRMLVDQAIIKRAYEAVQEHRACVVGMPVKDTIKRADGQQFVYSTLDRSRLWQIQTPQVFEVPLIKEAYRLLMKQPEINVTDDSMVVEAMLKIPVKLVEGTYENIKITTPEDLHLAEMLINRRESV
ncbi:MAG: 2-C-methyl-D-erythritol 4-phosphate cytidylyltransferase [Lachnospiraceae bacterium]